jgi:hypothetical protein
LRTAHLREPAGVLGRTVVVYFNLPAALLAASLVSSAASSSLTHYTHDTGFTNASLSGTSLKRSTGFLIRMYVDDNDETWPLAYDSAVGGHPNCEWWYAVGGGRNGSTTECEEYFLCPTYGSARLKGSTRPGSYGWNIYGTGTLTGPQHYGLGYRMSDMRTGLSGCHKNATIDEPTNTIAIGDSREADYGGNGIYIIGHSSMTYMPTCHRDGERGQIGGGDTQYSMVWAVCGSVQQLCFVLRDELTAVQFVVGSFTPDQFPVASLFGDYSAAKQ